MIKNVYLARTKDESLWKSSSSGGVFWALVVNMIENHHGICYGAKFTKDFRVIHDRAESLSEAEVFRGSKYLQSDMKNCYKLIQHDLKEGRQVLFSGTPCQVMAVKKFIQPNLWKNLVLVEFLCHGVPSPKVFSDYLELQESTYNAKVEDVSFRGKRMKNSVQDMYIRFDSGKEYKSFGTHDIYYKFYLHEMISRVSCASCPFANMDRKADITISDYWGDSNNIPEIFEKKHGLSGVFINTEKGETFWKESVKKMTVAESTISVCSQGTLYHPIAMAKNRKEFWNIYLRDGIVPAFEQNFGSYKQVCRMRMLKNVLNEIGILKIIQKVRGLLR